MDFDSSRLSKKEVAGFRIFSLFSPRPTFPESHCVRVQQSLKQTKRSKTLELVALCSLQKPSLRGNLLTNNFDPDLNKLVYLLVFEC